MLLPRYYACGTFCHRLEGFPTCHHARSSRLYFFAEVFSHRRRPSPHPHGRALHPMFRLSPKTNACGTVINLEAGLPTTAFHRLLTFNGQPKVSSQSCAEHGRASMEVSKVEWNTDRFSDSAPIMVVLLCISIQYSRVNPRRRLA
jgi:hypothetical protein